MASWYRSSVGRVRGLGLYSPGTCVMNESPDSVVESVLANGNVSPPVTEPCDRLVGSLRSRSAIFIIASG